MASSTASLGLHDVLAQLPITSTAEYSKGRTIYDPDNLSNSLYLVSTGKVGISQITDDGGEVLLEIVRPKEVFGESAFLDRPCRPERARAIENVTLMTWAVSEIEDLVTKRPHLAMALLQVFAHRNAEFAWRIGSFSTDTVERRLARSLIRLSERLGTQERDGSVRMMPFTHDVLSRYVGTSREVVTQHMNRFRKQGYVTYSRRSILLYLDPLKTVLDRSGGAPAEAIS